MEKCTTAEGFVFHKAEPTFLISMILILPSILIYSKILTKLKKIRLYWLYNPLSLKKLNVGLRGPSQKEEV